MTIAANNDKLKNMLVDIFMMDASEYADDRGPNEIEGWDSLATVSMSVSIQQQFGEQMSIEDVAAIHNIGDIRQFLRSRGVAI